MFFVHTGGAFKQAQNDASIAQKKEDLQRPEPTSLKCIVCKKITPVNAGVLLLGFL